MPNIEEERHKGSPSTPHISILRLQIWEDRKLIKSVLVVFRIVKQSDGLCQPWRIGVSALPIYRAKSRHLKLFFLAGSIDPKALVPAAAFSSS